MIFYLPDARLLRPSGRNPLHHASFFSFVVVIIALYKCSGSHCGSRNTLPIFYHQVASAITLTSLVDV
jgi:hypothetical protein